MMPWFWTRSIRVDGSYSLYSLLAESLTYTCGSIEAATRCNDGLYISKSWFFVDAGPMIENVVTLGRSMNMIGMGVTNLLTGCLLTTSGITTLRERMEG